MEMYRSGRNEADSKSVDGSNHPGVRIPPSPPEITPAVGFPECWLFPFLVRNKEPQTILQYGSLGHRWSARDSTAMLVIIF